MSTMLSNFRFNARIDGNEYKNKFRDYIQYLKDLDCYYPQLTYMDMFINQINSE